MFRTHEAEANLKALALLRHAFPESSIDATAMLLWNDEHLPDAEVRLKIARDGLLVPTAKPNWLDQLRRGQNHEQRSSKPSPARCASCTRSMPKRISRAIAVVNKLRSGKLTQHPRPTPSMQLNGSDTAW